MNLLKRHYPDKGENEAKTALDKKLKSPGSFLFKAFPMLLLDVNNQIRTDDTFLTMDKQIAKKRL